MTTGSICGWGGGGGWGCGVGEAVEILWEGV